MTTPSGLSPELLAKLDAMSQGELLQRRAAIIAKGESLARSPAAGDVSRELSNLELEELVTIFAKLRQRSSGPPSAKKTSAKKSEQALGSLL